MRATTRQALGALCQRLTCRTPLAGLGSLGGWGLLCLLGHQALAHASPGGPLALDDQVPGFATQVVARSDNQGLPFLVVDKQQARVWLFTPAGVVLGRSAALLGQAIGDTAVPGIGERKLSHIQPDERITTAGRFPSALGRNLLGQEVLWVDYEGAMSLHRLIAGQPSERRAQRLATPTPLDKRITYGCINVPVAFFNALVLPTVRPHGAMVYVLPEIRPLTQVFDFLPADSVR